MKYLFNYSLLENVQQSKKLLDELSIPHDNNDYLKIKDLLKNNLGYVYWFTNQFFKNGIPFEELSRIYDIIKNEPNTISKFTKPVINLDTIEDFWDEYLKIKNKIAINKIYSQFPSTQRKLIMIDEDEDKELLLDLYKDEKKENYLKKVSRYKTRKELISTLNLFLYTKTSNNYDTLLNNLKKDGVHIVYENEYEDIIIARVNYNQILKYGANTSWCIVRSEYTFNSYNSSELSQQFIIFLLDRNDNYSKIGVTTSILGYRTAHLQNDGYLSLQELNTLLEDRKINVSILYPSKESSLTLDWSFVENKVLSDIGFSEKEIIEKKRKDISKLDWDLYPVEFLLNSGFSNKEIISKKKVYGNYTKIKPVQTDLELFTKEEVEQYNLLDKTILYLKDIKKYSIDEIRNKNLISRTVDIKIDDLGELGFSYEEILRLSKIQKFSSDKISEIIKGKSRKQLVNIIKSVFLSPLNIDYKDRDYIRHRLSRLVSINNDDISLPDFISILNSSYYTDFYEKLSFLDNLYDLDINKLKIILSDNNSKIKSLNVGIIYSMTNNNNKIKNLCIEYLSTINVEETYTFKDMGEIRDVLVNKIDRNDLYEYLHNLIKKNIVGKSGWSKITNIRIYNNNRVTDIEETIRNLEFWDLQNIFTLEEISSVFYNSTSIYSAKKVIEFLNKNNISLEGNGYSFIKNILERNNDTIEILIFCIENGIDVQDSYTNLIDYVKKNKNELSEYRLIQIKGILKDKEEYIKDLDEMEVITRINQFKENTLSTSGYYWKSSGNRYTKFTDPSSWYSEYEDLINKVDYIELDNNWKNETLISTIILLAKVDKLDIFKIDIVKGYKDIVKVILDVHTTNGKKTWNIDLNEEERKRIYVWLDNHIKNSQEISSIIRFILPCYYIYDKPKLERYLIHLEKVRNNYEYIGRNNIPKFKTFRMYLLIDLIKYFVHINKYDEIENIFKRYTFTKAEKKNTLDNSHYFEVFAKDRTPIRNLIKKYFYDSNESYIMGWSDFR